MNSTNVHFILKGKLGYKDLAPVFPKILNIILEENEHFQEDEDADTRNMFVELNMNDILQNKKPEGYNRKGKYRLIFPIDSKEFYVSTFGVKNNDIKRVSERIEDVMNSTKPKLKFDIVQETEEDY